MKLEQRQKEKLKTSMRLFYLVLALMPLMVAASYTWFSLSRTPKVNEMGLSVSGNAGMELAFGPEDAEWTQYLDFREVVQEKTTLKPVTWSEKDQAFYAAVFGADGRMSGIAQQVSEAANTNRTGSNGFYLKSTCYARTGEPVKVSLSPAVVQGDGREGAGTYVIGTPVWNNESISHDNGGYGAQYAVRVGFMVTKFDAVTKTRTGESVFYIYEPNSEQHIDGTHGYQKTPSVDGGTSLVPEDRLILQTTSKWSEADPVQKDVVIRELGEFTTDTYLFNLSNEEFAKIDIYVWLEGQDVDCTNTIGHEAQIFVNVQFVAQPEGQSGMDEIE